MIRSSITLRRMNTELVRAALRDNEFTTKNSLAETTGLSVATCGNILKELLRTGEVREIQTAESTGGRPSRQFVYNEEFSHAAVIYLRQEASEKTVFSGVINTLGEVVWYDTRPLSSGTVAEVEEVLQKMVSLYPKIKAASIGVPAVINNGVIGDCDIAGLSGVSLAGQLSQVFGIPIICENDVNSTALGFYRRNSARGAESIAYLYYPHNGRPGAGIIVHGKILRGHTNFAGEVAYLPLSVKFADQGKIQQDPDGFAELAARTILSINAVINPVFVVISGYSFTSGVRSRIQNALKLGTPPGHDPCLRFEEDIHESYLEGLKFLALKKLSFQYEIVKK